MKKFLYILVQIFPVLLSAQQEIIGKVVDNYNIVIDDANVFNIHTGEHTH